MGLIPVGPFAEPEISAAENSDRSTQGVDLATWCNDSHFRGVCLVPGSSSSDVAILRACVRGERNDRMRPANRGGGSSEKHRSCFVPPTEGVVSRQRYATLNAALEG